MTNQLKAKIEDTPVYLVADKNKNKNKMKKHEEDRIITEALNILEERINKGPVMDGPNTVKNFLIMKNAKHQGREVFSVMFLDSQHKLIEYREMFFGTLNQTAVYPREILRAMLELNAHGVILCHNHPSGSTTPSSADKKLTDTIKNVLSLVDGNVLDHIITAGGKSLSFAEQGLCL